MSLISADRRSKPTLMLTILRLKVKSSTKDLSLPIFEIVIQHLLEFSFQCVAIIWYKSIFTRITLGEVNIDAFQHGFGLRGVQP